MSQISVSSYRQWCHSKFTYSHNTQTLSGTTTLHTTSIFHSHIKYAWMCAWHLPSLGLCSPQEARLMCNWEVCWINQQFICFLIEITLGENTENINTDPSHIVFCLLSIWMCVFTNSLLRFKGKYQCWKPESAFKGRNIFAVSMK